MSNIFSSENLEQDYAAFEKTLFDTNQIKYLNSSTFKPYLKRHHRLIYTIAIFQIKLQNSWPTESNRYVFINEILSDFLSNTSICVIGFYYSSQILLRRAVENFYNHIYYFEHPVEFMLLNMGRNEYTPIHDLKLYYEAHPIINQIKNIDKNIKLFNDSLFNHYQELNRTVHTKGVDFMGLANNLDEIKPDFDIEKHFDIMNKSAQNIIYLLYKFHTDIQFTQIEKTTISSSFPKHLRKDLFS